MAKRFGPDRIEAMQGIKDILMASVALCGLGLTLYLWSVGYRNVESGTPALARPTGPATAANQDIKELQKQIAALRSEVSRITASSQPGSAGQAAGVPVTTSPAIDARLRNIETNLAQLQSAMNGVSIEKSSATRAELFAAEEGYLKADEYFEAGKYAIAGEGYLTFVQHHPDHPDVREVLKKARDAFLKAGYNDKAFWVHEEMMKQFPQHQVADVWEQAQLEKQAGLYDAAVTHASQAAELAATPEERLWRRLYWAWYVQLRDGTPAGIAAMQQVQNEIVAAGVSNPKLAQRAREKLLEMQRQAAAR